MQAPTGVLPTAITQRLDQLRELVIARALGPRGRAIAGRSSSGAWESWDPTSPQTRGPHYEGSPAPLRRPRCRAASEPRAFSRLRRGSFSGLAKSGRGCPGRVGRERPPGEPGDLTPHSLPAAVDGENRPWLMMMI